VPAPKVGGKGIKGPRNDLRRHAYTGILDAKRDVLSCWHIPDAGIVLIDRRVTRFDSQCPPSGMASRALMQVKQRVFQLIRINLGYP
jgi:hypothetical protein